MNGPNLRERLLISLFALLTASWAFGTLDLLMAPAGSLLAGAVFTKYKAGLRRRKPAAAALSASLAIGAMMVPILAASWFVITATTAPGEAPNFLVALFDFEGDADRLRGAALFAVACMVLAGTGGAIAAWWHVRQLDRDYWLTEQDDTRPVRDK